MRRFARDTDQRNERGRSPRDIDFATFRIHTEPSPPSTGLALTAADRQALTVLALPQRKPTNINLFSSAFFNPPVTGFPVSNTGTYPTGVRMDPDGQPKPNESQTRTQLQQYLSEQFGSDTA